MCTPYPTGRLRLSSSTTRIPHSSQLKSNVPGVLSKKSTAWTSGKEHTPMSNYEDDTKPCVECNRPFIRAFRTPTGLCLPCAARGIQFVVYLDENYQEIGTEIISA
jgi:hypothetical protein